MERTQHLGLALPGLDDFFGLEDHLGENMRIIDRWASGVAGMVYTIGSVPSQSGSLTYTGNAQSPIWSDYDSTKMTISGTTSATNAGTYEATFTPVEGCQWADGATDAKTVTWSIGKAAGSLSLSATSIFLKGGSEGTVTVEREGDGAISASSSNTGVATVSVSGTTVTIKAVATGTAVITVRVAAGSNYTAPGSETVVVTAFVCPALEECTPAKIQEVARSGQAANCWSVGDKVPITLNGTVGALTFSEETYYAFIIGFDHNPDIEGSNTIHFQFAKTSDGTDIAFVDSGYGSTSGQFYMRSGLGSSGSNDGGWEGSHMRNDICSAFYSALPQEWQDVIGECTKYSDNTGGSNSFGGDISSHVTATQDKIWLLSLFEVFGNISSANSAEQNYQKYYDYYKNGNPVFKYNPDSGKSCNWWLRSLYPQNTATFCYVDDELSYACVVASTYSYGFAPGFMVA